MNQIFIIISTALLLACSINEEPITEYKMENAGIVDSTKKEYSYLALGDSYTIGESVAENERFPVQLSARIETSGIPIKPAIIVAQTGWTTNELSAAIKQQKITGTFDIISLLIGVNNQYRGRDTDEYRLQLQDLLKTSIRYAGGNPKNLIVISIPDYGVTPFAKNRNPEKIAQEIDKFNKIKKEETQKVGANFIDITGISRRAKNQNNLLANDGLHPSGEMYRLWVKKIFPTVEQILKN